jgi:hypothetical protein
MRYLGFDWWEEALMGVFTWEASRGKAKRSSEIGVIPDACQLLAKGV